MMASVRSYRCPKKNGGCGRDDAFIIALDDQGPSPKWPRLICDCSNCGHRMSFPLSTEETGPWTGPIDATGRSVKK